MNTPQPVAHYRVQKAANNSVTVRPPVGVRFDEDQWKALRAWIAATGEWTAIRTSAQSLRAVARSKSWADFPASTYVTKAEHAASEKARENEAAHARRREGYTAALQTYEGQWLRALLPPDTLNDSNAARLAEAIATPDPTERQLGAFLLNWRAGEKLAAYGLPASVTDRATVVAWLRQRMLASDEHPRRTA